MFKYRVEILESLIIGLTVAGVWFGLYLVRDNLWCKFWCP